MLASINIYITNAANFSGFAFKKIFKLTPLKYVITIIGRARRVASQRLSYLIIIHNEHINPNLNKIQNHQMFLFNSLQLYC